MGCGEGTVWRLINTAAWPRLTLDSLRANTDGTHNLMMSLVDSQQVYTEVNYISRLEYWDWSSVQYWCHALMPDEIKKSGSYVVRQQRFWRERHIMFFCEKVWILKPHSRPWGLHRLQRFILTWQSIYIIRIISWKCGTIVAIKWLCSL